MEIGDGPEASAWMEIGDGPEATAPLASGDGPEASAWMGNGDGPEASEGMTFGYRETGQMERVNRILRHEAFVRHMRDNRTAEKERIFCHHDIAHFLDVARIAMIINLQEGMELSQGMIYGAALLHDIGRHEQYKTGIPHEIASARIAPDILADCGYAPGEVSEITEAILLHRDGESGSRKDLAGILYRADKASRACFVCEASEQCGWKEEKKNHIIDW